MEIIAIKLEYHLENLDKCKSEEEKEYHLSMAKASARVLKQYVEST